MSDPQSEAQDDAIAAFLSMRRITRNNMIHLIRDYLVSGSESAAFPDALKRLSTLHEAEKTKTPEGSPASEASHLPHT